MTAPTLALFNGPVDEKYECCPRCGSHTLYWSDFIECDVCGTHIVYACAPCAPCAPCGLWWDCAYPESAELLAER